MHHTDPIPHRIGRRFNLHLLTMDIDIPFRWLIQAKQNIHQCTLPGSILSQQGMNFSRTDIKTDVTICIRGAENLCDMLHPENFCCSFNGHSAPPPF